MACIHMYTYMQDQMLPVACPLMTDLSITSGNLFVAAAVWRWSANTLQRFDSTDWMMCTSWLNIMSFFVTELVIEKTFLYW